MAKKEHISETLATQFLRKHEEHDGTALSAQELEVDEHSLLVR